MFLEEFCRMLCVPQIRRKPGLLSQTVCKCVFFRRSYNAKNNTQKTPEKYEISSNPTIEINLISILISVRFYVEEIPIFLLW